MTSKEPTPPAPDNGQPERFLEAVATPLVKNIEHQHAAKNVMRAMVIEAGALEDATRRIGSKAFKWKRWLLPLLGFAMVLALVTPSLWQFVKLIHAEETYYSHIYGYSRRNSTPLIRPDVWRTSRLTADEKMILLGDEDAPSDKERLNAIVERFPDRPEFYAEYAEHCVLSSKKLPKGFEATVARIDPENGYFFYLKAIETGLGSIHASSGSYPTFYVRDATRLREANEWLRRAANAPEFKSYKEELREQRARLMPPREDFMTASLLRMTRQDRYWRYDMRAELEGLYPLAEIQLLTKPEDAARFRILLGDYIRLQRRLMADSRLRTNRILDPSTIPGAIALSADMAEKLKIEPEKTHLREVEDWLTKNPPRSSSPPRAGLSPAEKVMIEKGSSLHRSNLYHSDVIPEDRFPSEGLLAPGRYAEHALWGRVASLLMVALLAVLAWVMLLYRFRHGRLPRLVTHSLKRALTWADYLWILMLGVGLPLLWHQVVRQSPRGGLDFSLQHGIEKLISPQWGLLAFMVLMATTLAVRWRVKRRLRGLDLGIGRSAFTWICLLLTAATMPLMPCWIENPSWPDESLLVAGAVPALWFVVSLTRGLFMPVESIFGQLLVSRVTATSWLLACVVFAACAPVYYEVERHWVARDTLLQSPDFPNALEKQITAELNREDLELLERMEK